MHATSRVIEWGMFEPPDLTTIFVPSTPLLEIFIRGTLTYLALFVLLRLTLKRESGSVGMTNLLVIVLIADAAQNAMGDDYRSVPDGILLVITILSWSYALDRLGYQFPLFGRFVHPAPLPIVEGGRINRRNMRRELITTEELLTQLRLQGLDDIEDVEYAYVEGNGEISVLGKGASGKQGDRRRSGG